MTTYQILSLCGFSTLFLGFVRYVHASIKKLADDNKATKLGVQAMLRSQMIADYNKWSERGYAPIYARDNFENCWKNYHELGANGVMDDIHHKFLELPTEKVS